jgi:TIR domain
VTRRVFISYRREDTGPIAGRVYDRLVAVLSKDTVFFDISSVRGGDDFVRKIELEIGRSNAALIFIGNKWLELPDQARKSRIWNANDYVRAEVRAALRGNALVLPILVSGTRMPKPEDLPNDIAGISSKNALFLRHETFDDDVDNIISTVLGETRRVRRWER